MLAVIPFWPYILYSTIHFKSEVNLSQIYYLKSVTEDSLPRSSQVNEVRLDTISTIQLVVWLLISHTR